MANLLQSFSSIDRKVITEVSSRSVESEKNENESHEVVEDPANWTPPVLHATDIYKIPMTFVLKRKTFLKEVEITIKTQHKRCKHTHFMEIHIHYRVLEIIK